MGFISKLFGRSETRASIDSPTASVSDIFYGQPDDGLNVSSGQALTYSPLYSGVKLIGNTVGCFPFPVYRRLAEGGKEKAADHPAYDVLNVRPNAWMSRQVFWRTIVIHAILKGNGYAYIDRDPKTLQVSQLILLDPTKVTPVTIDGLPGFEIEVAGQKVEVYTWEVIHVPNIGMDQNGLSVFDLFRQSIGLGLGAQTSQAKSFTNGSTVRGVLEADATVSDKAIANIKSTWAATYGGLSNAHKVALLEEGIKFKSINLSPADTQLLESRKHETNVWAAILNVPPHKIGGTNGTSQYTNIESANLDFLQDSISPWIVSIELEVNSKLFTEADKADHFAEFLLEGRLRADSTTRAAFYEKLFAMDAIVPDEIRERENMNPLPDGTGKLSASAKAAAAAKLAAATQPQQHEKADPTDPETNATPQNASGEDQRAAETVATLERRQLLQAGYADLLAVTVERAAEMTASEVRAMASDLLNGESVGKFNASFRSYVRTSAAMVEDAVRPVFKRYAAAVARATEAEIGAEGVQIASDFLDSYVEAFALRYMAAIRSAVLDITEGDDLNDVEERVGKVLADLKTNQLKRIGYEATRARQAFTREAYMATGVKQVRWHGADCGDVCRSLKGKLTDIGQPFVAKGQHTHNVFHGPIDFDCRCEVLPVRGN